MRNLLLVDDSDLDRMMMETVLDGRGFVCIAAQDGVQALEKMKEWPIDVVLTDLNMPRLDGLGLVKAIRLSHPGIPIILTTGAGSEDIAAQALAAGASSYLPKNKLSEMLFTSVQRVLDILDDGHQPARLDEALRVSRFEFEFGNNPAAMRTLGEFIEKTLRFIAKIDRNERLRICMAVDHGLHNALYRGNLEIGTEHKVPFIDTIGDAKTAELVDERMHSEPYASRKIQVVLEIRPDRFGIRIVDEGPGFDPQTGGDWEHSDARGIILMRALMDKVEYNERGNDLQLHHFLGNPPSTTAAGQVMPANETHAASKSTRKIAQLVCLNTGTVVKLGAKKFVVGTRASCHVRLRETGNVAPLHSMFVPEGAAWSVVHLSPDHQTLVNMNPIAGTKSLQHGDTVTIGSYSFELRFVQPSS